MKTCTKCNIEKSLDDFNNHPDGPMGKDISGFHIIKTFDCPIQAHLFETMFHLAGYGGFQHKY